jgi:hypothetical protein
MRNEFTAIVEQMTRGTSHIAPSYRAPMVRAKREKNAWRAFARRLPSSSSTDERNLCALCPLTPSKNLLLLDEAGETGPAPPPLWLCPAARAKNIVFGRSHRPVTLKPFLVMPE